MNKATIWRIYRQLSVIFTPIFLSCFVQSKKKNNILLRRRHTALRSVQCMAESLGNTEYLPVSLHIQIENLLPFQHSFPSSALSGR